MARGQDSAGNPRRALSPAIRDAIQAQNARRSYMFGAEETLGADTETRLSQMNPLNQVRAVVAMRDSVNSDIASSMSRPPHGRRNHASRLVGEQLAPQSAGYTMTLGEYKARTAGGRSPAGPSSLDPFPFGVGAAQRDHPVSYERPEAAFKRTGQPTGEESTTETSASMVEAERDFKKTSGHALMHPSTLDEPPKEKKTTKTPGY